MEKIKVSVWNGERIRRSVEVEPGTSIRECVRLLEPGRDEFQTPTICLLDGKPLLREDGGWEKACIEPGHEVFFAELPMGGDGSNAAMLVQILTTVVALVSYICIPVVGPFVAMGVQLVGSIVAGLIAMNAQGKQPASSAEQASPTYSLNSSGNMARLFQPEPEGFGRMRITPDYVAPSWPEYVDNEQYVHFCYGLGRGEYDVESAEFGDSLFWTASGGFTPMAEQSNGWGWESSVGIDLPHGGAWTGVIPLCALDGAAKQARLSVRMPEGHGQYGYGSALWKYTPQACSIEYQTCKITSGGAQDGDWSEVQTANLDGGTADSGSLDGRSISEIAKRHGITRGLDLTFTGGRYGIRVRNVTAEIPMPAPETGYESGTVRQAARADSAASRCPATAIQIAGPDEEVTLFDTNVWSSGEVSGLGLYAPNAEEYDKEKDGWVGPYAANPAGTTCTQIRLDIVYPGGIVHYDDENDAVWWDVNIEAQYRAINDAGEATGSWQTLGSWTDSGHSTTAQRKTRICSVPDGRYEVRMRRTSDTRKYASEEPSVDDCQWAGLRSKLLGQLRFPQTVVAVRVRATNVLSQQSSQAFRITATRKLPVWNAGAWSEPVPTRSWAAAVAAICQEPWGGQLPDAQLDLETLWAIDAALQEKSWHFDAYIDGAYSLWQLIQEACQAVLVVPRMQGTVLSFVQDEPGRAVEYELNARNIVRGSMQVTYATWTEDTPDDVVLQYLDADAHFQQRDVRAVIPARTNSAGVVTRPGSESTEPATLDWIGITDRTHAYRVAMRYSTMNRFRRVTVTCQTEAFGRLLQAGDVVLVNHPRFRDTSAGVLESWSQADPAWGDKPTLTLEKDFHQSEPGQSDSFVSLTRPDGTMWGPVAIDGSIHPVVTPSGRTVYKAVLAPDDLAAYIAGGGDAPWGWLSSGTASQPTAYALHDGASGEAVFKRRMIVQKVVPDDHWHFTLTLVNDAPEVADYDGETVPPWNARSNANAVLQAPRNLAVSVNPATGVASVSWAAPSGTAKAVWYDVQHRISSAAGWVHDGVTPYTARTIAGAQALAAVRVRALSDSHESEWQTWEA